MALRQRVAGCGQQSKRMILNVPPRNSRPFARRYVARGRSRGRVAPELFRIAGVSIGQESTNVRLLFFAGPLPRRGTCHYHYVSLPVITTRNAGSTIISCRVFLMYRHERELLLINSTHRLHEYCMNAVDGLCNFNKKLKYITSGKHFISILE